MARRGLLIAVVASALLTLAPDAHAHAVLARSEPADGSTLVKAPREIRLRFSERISPRFRVVRVVDGHGHAVAGARVRADGPRGLSVALPDLGRGASQARWAVVAAE